MEYEGYTYPDDKLACNRENMTKLVEALESGKYEKGTHYLLTLAEDGKRKHCCLGVASEISGLGTWQPYVTEHPSYLVDGRSSAAGLVPAVKGWLGVDNEMLQLTGPSPTGDLVVASEMNDLKDDDTDEQVYTFKDIAAQIRKVYLTD